MLGPSLMVAPVLYPGQLNTTTYVPRDTWCVAPALVRCPALLLVNVARRLRYNYFTSERLTPFYVAPGGVLTYSTDPLRPMIMARAGAIIPHQQPLRTVRLQLVGRAARPGRQRMLTCVPPSPRRAPRTTS